MKPISKKRASLYATVNDFSRIFREDMQSLYLLALVLTADGQKAEQCFVAGLDDCASSNQVFKEWARSWARRVVVKNSIRSVQQDAAEHELDLIPADSANRGLPPHPELHLPAEISALLQLPARERFAFVMSFCEGYSDHDCALLLGCTRETLVAARLRALQQLEDCGAAKGHLRSESATAVENHGGISIGLTPDLATVA